MLPATPKAVLFDLFDTVVHFAPHVPTIAVAGERRRTTMGWLRDVATAALPDVRFEDLAAALLAVSEEIVRNRPPEYLEVPSAERFRRALQRLDLDSQRIAAVAPELSAAHMQHLADQTRLPEGHAAVLQRLSRTYRLALISNFDHGPTARRVLDRHGVAAYFEPIVISDGFGRRKPHPSIFHATLERMQLDAAEAVYVGDSLGDDVVGARNAGLAAVWINLKGTPIPATMPTPDAEIRALTELPAVLGCS